MKGITKHIFQFVLVLGLLLAGESVMWGESYNYYAQLTVGITTGSPTGAGTVYATPDENEVDASLRKITAEKSTNTSGGSVDLWGHAVSNEGFHFLGWTNQIENTVPDSGFTENPQKFSLQSSTTAASGDQHNAINYNRYAIFAVDEYYAKLNVIAGEHGSAYATENSKSTTIKGGDVEFEIIAVADPGYHFVNWTKSGDEGGFKNENSSTTTFIAPAANEYDKEKAKPYTVTAHFAVDEYNAKLTSAVSSLSDGSGHLVRVSTDETNWDESMSKSANAPDIDVPFYVKAEPAPGYKFIGWSESDGSSDTVTGLGAKGTFAVKSSSTQGGTNEKTLYAIFKKEYSIMINANSSAEDPKSKIVFKIVSKSDGGKKYRVSVPVGGSITLKDVGEGGYTITPETIWHWSYKVEPASAETDYDANNLSTNNFTVTPSGKNKKHDEASSTVTE